MVYNNECVELFSFLVEEYNTSTLFIFQDIRMKVLTFR